MPIRLTRRAHALGLLLLGLCILAIIGAAALNAEPARHPSGPPITVVVQPGDTLWQIAADAAPAEDPVEVIEQIRAVNHLHTSAVQPGQQLVVPGP